VKSIIPKSSLEGLTDDGKDSIISFQEEGRTSQQAIDESNAVSPTMRHIKPDYVFVYPSNTN
jgi:hypothetical protein